VSSRESRGAVCRRLAPKPHWVAAGIALVVVTLFGLLAEYQNGLVFEQRLRAEVRDRLSVVRAKLEGNINGSIQLVRGLVSTVATEPDMDQPRFAKLARNLIDERSPLRNVAGAPGLVVSLVYPVEGNEKVFGLDYRSNEVQREAALRAREQREMILAGPVDLVQGGRGFIGRFPVFIEQPDGGSRFWGLLSAVIDVERLYRDSGLLDPDLGIDVALTGRDATGAAGMRFHGSESIRESNPVTSEVALPSGSWEIAAIPKGGWKRTPDNAWLIRLLIFTAGVLIIGPITVAGRLYDDRQRHIRKLRQGEEQLEALSHRLKLALDASSIGVWEFEIESRQLYWDERIKELHGVGPDDDPADPHDWRKLVHPDDLDRAKGEIASAIDSDGGYESEYRIVTPDGETRSIRAMGRVYRNSDGTRRIVGVNWDVSADVALREGLSRAKQHAEARNVELEEARAQMEHNSLHDSLTGLPNRRYLDRVLTDHAAGGTATDSRLALLHIDLDRFKHINDTMGHAAGDAMLIHAASILKENLRDDDFVARVGGDEFVVVARSAESNEDLANLALRIIDRMRQPVPYDGHECRFGVSIGVAGMAGAGDDPRRQLINADIALYRAKNRGRNRYEFFTESLQAEISRTKRVADEILNGLERNEFLPYFQPQFDATTLDITGVEALARWQHPTEGLLTPDFFLKTADELNVMATIDRIILEQALWQSCRWAANGIAIPKISVNVSSSRLHDDELIESLEGLDFAPGTLSFELLESIFLDESDEAVARNIRRLKRRGIEIEIDDFGTGYASIVSLLKLRPRRLKIDRQLVKPIVRSGRQRHLVSSIIDIGRSLGIEVIGEGVETREHARILAKLGCNGLQGYALARPMSSKALMAFVAAQKWRKAS
jgi:diguanylate cyclase (GGDEF)-like protein/PAS domain S-box-containing protein